MATTIQRQALSDEPVQANVHAPISLTTQTVSIAVIAAGATVVGGDFDSASWIGTEGTTRTAELPADTYAAGSYDVYVKVVSLDTPVVYAGRMIVT